MSSIAPKGSLQPALTQALPAWMDDTLQRPSAPCPYSVLDRVVQAPRWSPQLWVWSQISGSPESQLQSEDGTITEEALRVNGAPEGLTSEERRQVSATQGVLRRKTRAGSVKAAAQTSFGYSSVVAGFHFHSQQAELTPPTLKLGGQEAGQGH